MYPADNEGAFYTDSLEAGKNKGKNFPYKQPLLDGRCSKQIE